MGRPETETRSLELTRSFEEYQMKSKTARAKPIVYKNAPEHPYKQYESHPTGSELIKASLTLLQIGI
jgi:hypothetical protein